jgi:ATP-dependent DNA helicase RecG
MRPPVLYPLFAPLTSLGGIGSRLAPLVGKLVGGDKVADLLWHLPHGLVDRRATPKVAAAVPGQIATLAVRVVEHEAGGPARRGRVRPYRVLCADETGFIHLVFFAAHGDFIAKRLPPGQERIVSGRIEEYEGRRQMVHPDYVVPPGERATIPALEPVYPNTAGLAPRSLRKAAAEAARRAPALPEWSDPHLVRQRGWPAWKEAVVAAHAPETAADLDPLAPARLRLAYDELLANQIALRLVRAKQVWVRGRRLAPGGTLRAKALAALPFALTGAQRRALAEIDADMASDKRMMRLLQGDVGSGKTVVAYLAALAAVDIGAQGAFMAPTEILARQHFATVSALAAPIGVRVRLLTGRDTAKAREATLADLAAGAVDILIGTHALVVEDVAYKDLGFVVVDEQHRFGVHQRLALAGKGERPDTLVMTATPIPRTLQLAHYGDLDASRIDEKPPGRQKIDTRVLPLDRLDDVYAAVARALESGARAYWVCPLVDETEANDLAAATARHEALVRRFGARVGLVHGQMPGGQRDLAMKRFAAGDLGVLVATTVIEVGVDVPEATVMVIEHAERFGLAQLHQLRGRVGRGTGRSTCLLLYQGPLGETARARLAILRETEDGFRIAEEDLRLRGAGDLLGRRQSGLPAFRLADLATQAELLPLARDDARLALERDPELESERGRAIRTLLYLFERDAGVRLLRSG